MNSDGGGAITTISCFPRFITQHLRGTDYKNTAVFPNHDPISLICCGNCYLFPANKCIFGSVTVTGGTIKYYPARWQQMALKLKKKKGGTWRYLWLSLIPVSISMLFSTRQAEVL